MPSGTGHIAIVGLTSQSHLYPSLALIRELVERGHRVSVGVGESQRDLVAPTGAGIVGHPSLLPDPHRGEANAVTELPKDAGEVMLVFLREAMHQLPYLTKRFDGDPPDLVLCDPGAMAGQVLAHRYGVPAVTLSIMPMTWPSEDTEPDPDVLASLGSAGSAREYYRQAGEWLAENGIEQDAHELQSHPDGTLSLVPRVMQPGAERAPGTVRFIGPCLAPERLADRSWTPPPDGRPVVLVSLGNSWNDRPEFYRACQLAFAGSDWHVVLVAGRYARSPELRDVPDCVEVRERVPQLTVLEHADVFVTHAGMGSCVEALWYGVPTVAIPQGIDQYGNADRLAELGVGRRLAADAVTPDSLRDAVEEISGDGEVAVRLDKIRAELRSAGGVAGAADAVESFLRR